MRLSLRFIIPLLVVLAAVAWLLVPLVDNLTQQWFMRDMDTRATLLATTMHDPLQEMIGDGNDTRIEEYFTKITQDERLQSLGLCVDGTTMIATPTFPPDVTCGSLGTDGEEGRILSNARSSLYLSVRPLAFDSGRAGRLILVHDMSFVARRSAQTREYLFYFLAILGVAISLLTVVIAHISWRGWVHGLRALLRGELLLRPSDRPDAPELRPVASDLRALIRDIDAEHRARHHDQLIWNADTLREVLHGELRGQEVIVVSNREPFIHVRTEEGIRVRRPASGLVTALEPIMRACSGTWVAHGSGSADRDVVDRHDRVGVPPDRPAYNIRRIWLSAAEEEGYYYGFSNEGLWPLCHIAHVRPVFRRADWEQYEAVNRRFANAVVEEAHSSDPIVLVQDYHLALLPRYVREALPNATIVTFWHIPWPNPEAFGICPWRDQLLDGLLGSSILGFHTQFHCNNFMDTVDRLLEARVDREMFGVTYRGERTAVKRYPISIEFPPEEAATWSTVETCRHAVMRRYDLPEGHRIGIGVDRLDYTKGIEERFRAVERLMELHPSWIGKFTFVQIAAPTRERIEQYRDYERRVRELAEQINARFTGHGPKPIVLRIDHVEHEEVYEHYRGADVCIVTSLHDGMNLVAKEFVAARDDERGTLVLSRFTGAARELPEALVVNPYDSDRCAEAIHLALTMPEPEQRARMRLMRGLIRDFNVYRWAGRMLTDAAGMRNRSRLIDRAAARARWGAGLFAHKGEQE